jgi:hypothetical protein
LPQTMKAAGQSKADMTLLYTLDDFDQQAAGIRRFQQQVLGLPDDTANAFFAAKGPERAKKTTDEEGIVTLTLLNLGGGPDRTRICDLYRVKVLASIAYKVRSLKTRDLHTSDLDRNWNSAGVWTSYGPHIPLAAHLLQRA